MMPAFVIKPKLLNHHLDNFISFPLIYSFVGVRCVLLELQTENENTAAKVPNLHFR